MNSFVPENKEVIVTVFFSFSYLSLIVERRKRIARELDTSAKREALRGRVNGEREKKNILSYPRLTPPTLPSPAPTPLRFALAQGSLAVYLAFLFVLKNREAVYCL